MEMFNTNQIIMAFVENNFLAMMLFLMFIKGLADISPWKWDNKIVELLYSMFSFLRPSKKWFKK